MLKNIARLRATLHSAPPTRDCRLLSQRISFCFSKKLYDLDEKQQRAIADFYALRFVRLFDPKKYISEAKSLRELLLDQEKFKQYIVREVNKMKGTRIECFSELGIDDKVIQETVQSFSFEKGATVDPLIWSQNRFKEAASFQNDGMLFITLNPQHHSSKIIHNLLQKSTPFVVYGQKGTGKSFSYLLYERLSMSIIACRLWKKQLPKVYELVPRVSFNQVKKLIYLPIKEVQSYQTIVDSLLRQISQIDCSSLSATEVTDANSFYKFFSQYLKLLRKVYSEKSNIQMMLIVDEANHFYSLFRLYKRSLFLKGTQPIQNDDGKGLTFPKIPEPNPVRYDQLRNLWFDQLKGKQFKQLRFEQKLLFFSGLFQSLKSGQHKVNLVLNSSQFVEANLISDWNKNYQPTFYNIMDHGRGGEQNLNISYSQNLTEPQYQLQLYHTFWFEMQRNLHLIFQQKKRKGILEFVKDQSTIMQGLKEIFMRTFNIISQAEEKPNKADQISQNETSAFDRWNIDVRHFNIRRYLKTYQFTKLLNHIKSIEDETSKTQIKTRFQQVKSGIQELRKSEISSEGFKRYLQKSVDQITYSRRYAILLLIRKEAIRQANENKGANRPFLFNYQALLSGYKNSQNFKVFKQITEQLNLGFTNQQRKTITFNMAPNYIEEFTSFLRKEYTFLQCYNFIKVMSRQGFSSGLAGNMMDIGFYQVFRTITFDLTLSIIGTKELSLIERKTYNIFKSIPHKRSNNKDKQELEKALDSLFSESKGQPNKQFASFPVKVLDNGAFQYSSNNGIYDLAINRYNDTTLTHELTLVDLTLGKLNHKLRIDKYGPQKQKLDSFVELKRSKGVKIQLNYVILAPKCHAQNYCKNVRGTKRHFEVNQQSKFTLQLGAISKDPKGYLRLENVNKAEEEAINDFLRMTVEQNIAHIEQTYSMDEEEKIQLQVSDLKEQKKI